MIRRLLPWIAAAVVGLAALAGPYLVAYAAQPPGFAFSGFLMNPVDGFSYLAKMRQGFDGEWFFQLPFAADPGPGSFLFVYYLALGHLQRLLQAPPDAIYHAARLFGAALLFGAAYVFFRAFLPTAPARKWAFALTLFGSGLGWVGIVLGSLPIDLWVPEAFPFASGFANAHFALSEAAMLLAFVALATDSWSRGWRIGIAAGAGLILGAVQPFGIVLVAVVAAVWLAWNRWSPPGTTGSSERVAGRVVPLGAFLATGLPWVIYDLWATRVVPALAAWSAQNITPTPSVPDVLLGLGAALFLAAFAAWKLRSGLSSPLRLLVVWIGVGLILAFAPLALQRRMLLGIFIPIAALAGLALAGIAGTGPRSRTALAVILFAVCLPTTILLILGTTARALSQESDIVLTTSERAAYRDLDAIAPEGSLVLTGDVSGNRLPAFADVRVIYGHPFETPNAEEELSFVEGLLRSTTSTADVLAALHARSVDFVLIGDRERRLGPLPWLAGLRQLAEHGEYVIYQVPSR